MNAMVRLGEGNKVYTGTEYDNCTGYLVGTYTRTYHDRRRGCTVKVEFEVINLGRPDRGIPVDPDVLLEDEPWELDAGLAKAAEAVRVASQARRDAADEKITAHLTEHGPSHLSELLPLTEWDGVWVLRRHLQAHPEMYQSFGFRTGMWGLVGQEWTAAPRPQPKITQRAEIIRSYLLKAGPAPAAQIARVIGRDAKQVNNCLVQFTQLFCVVRMRPAQGQTPATRIWGLVGVHDGEAR